MTNRPFMDRSAPPVSKAISDALAAMAVHYVQMLDIAKGFKSDWTYSAAGGWLQKISDSKKALCYIIVEHGYFTVSLAMRDNERTLLLADDSFAEIHYKLQAARKVAEGYHLLFDVKDERSFAPAGKLINRLVALRK